MCGDKCVEETNGSNITVKERGRRANFRNPDRHSFLKIQVDGCLLNEKYKKADWIVTKVGIGSIIIELKGKNLDQACQQLKETLDHPRCKPWLEARKAMLIVCSRYPSIDTTVQRLQLKARKQGVRLNVVCDQGNFIFEDMLAA